MTAEEFEAAYAARSEITVEQLHQAGRWPVKCGCGYSLCEGWVMGHQWEDAIFEDRLRKQGHVIGLGGLVVPAGEHMSYDELKTALGRLDVAAVDVAVASAPFPAARVRFIDLVRHAECVLVIPAGGEIHPAEPDGLKIGVAHTRAGSVCPRLADIAVELDAFFCPLCQWNGRVSGGWVLDQIRAANP